MAVSGSGTSADPYIVSSWDEYLEVRPSSVATETFIKFGNKNIENGEFTGSGSGTRNDPYICNTFEEICITLGCNKIWQADIYDDCEETDKMKVYYNSKTDKYAKHVRTPTTIDLEEYLDRDDVTKLLLYGVTNFNGWTLTNIRFINTSGVLDFYKTEGVIITNFVFELTTSSADVVSDLFYIKDSCIQLNLSASQAIGYSYTINVFPRTGSENGRGIKRTTIDISGVCNYFEMFDSADTDIYECKIYDSIINYDLLVTQLSNYNYGVYINTKIIGKIEALQYTDSGTYHRIGRSFNNCIIDADIKTVDDGRVFAPYATNNTNSLYNSDKLSLASGKNGFTGISTESLESAEDIAATGFPIGVD